MEKEKKNAVSVCLADYMKEVIATLEADKKHPAVHTYKSTLNSFRKFWPDDGEKMPITHVFTPGQLKEYETWLRDINKSWDTVSTYMRTLQAVYHRLVKQGILPYEMGLFSDVYTKVESHTKRALTEEQMNTLARTDFEALPRELQSVLAYFLLMFMFRGMPFIDLAMLRKQDVKGDYIVYCRHKTGRRIALRIPPEARPLLEAYGQQHPNSGYLFPILDDTARTTRQHYDQYQKALSNFNRKLAALATLLLPGVKISSYTARHTWATVAYHRNLPPGIISKALGHSSIKVTETYLKPFEDERIDQANDDIISAIFKSDKKNAAA